MSWTLGSALWSSKIIPAFKLPLRHAMWRGVQSIYDLLSGDALWFKRTSIIAILSS